MFLIIFTSMFGCPPSTAGIPTLNFFKSYIHSKMTPEAEKFNGWAAMLGFVAAFGAYATTGQIIPGIF